jgi:cytochrome o ubiquinol oxidase subunit 1
VNAFFGIMTMVIAIPTGVKVFNWLFTMFRGRIIFDTPMLWFMGFLATFILGGMTGVLMSIPGVDFELHNSVFLVAHFHNMVIGGVLFGLFAGYSYWFPKIAGFRLNERIGAWAFWSWLIGFLLAFMPLYALGLMGMTRRLDQVDPMFHPLLVLVAIGACVIMLGIFFQALQIIVSIRQRKQNPAGSDPWHGRTLEWATSSPPPAYNFAVIPRVHSRDAFWMEKQASERAQDGQTRPSGPERHLLHAHSPERIEMPTPTIMGALIAACAFAAGFGMVWHIWWLAALGLVVATVLVIARSFETEIEYTLKP